MTKGVTYWIMRGSEPIMAIRDKPLLSAAQVKQLALRQIDKCPGVVCPQGTTPTDIKARVIYGSVWVYD